MVDIYQVPGILKKRIGWLIALPVLFVALALVFLIMQTPKYRATAELLIDPQGLQIVGNDIVARENGEMLERLAVDSQAYVILSNTVLGDVVDKLGLVNDPAIAGKGGGLVSRLLGRVPATLTPEEKRGVAIMGLRERLQVVKVEKSFVFNIVASHPDRFKAAAIANEAARAYLDEARRSRADASLRASMALRVQAADLRKRVEAAEAEVENFRAQNGLISTGQAGLVADQQLQGFSSQLTQARVELERAKSNYDLVRNLTVADIEAGGLPANLQTTTLGTLRVQYARAAEQVAQASTTLGANHPQMRELRSQLENVRRQIGEELSRTRRSIRSDYQRAEATVAALGEEANRLKNTNVDQSKAQIQLRQLTSEAETLGTVYRSFLSRAKELEEQQDIDTSNSRVISQAVAPLKPLGPSKVMVLAAAAMFGFALAASASIGWEMLGGRLGSEGELVDRTGVPLIASLRAPDAVSAAGGPRRGGGLWKRGARAEAEATARQMAITRIAYALRHAFENERPANVLVLSCGEEPALAPLSRAIATGLYDMGEVVLIARADPGAPAGTRDADPDKDATQSQSSGRELRTRLSSRRRGDLQTGEDSAVAGASQAKAGRPRTAPPFKVEHLDGRPPENGVQSLAREGQEFLVIDGGSALASPYLPVLLDYADAIVLVSGIGETSREELDRTLALLQPWRDRMIGNVALAA
ncbi:GumC family protein [Stappia taiwanensis]|uniref:GumC family protein n=1 Tax=Stappia taiwanensis TaxID=992267 RepID=A0A838XMU6_9HYPH|nr:GumC family protein [Stappia taiwanensis]MBA4612599.1 GumC family protein [Stappia taiwanensis]